MPAIPEPPFHRFGVRFTSDPTHNKSYLQGLLTEDSLSMYRGELFLNEFSDEMYYADSTGIVRRFGERSIIVNNGNANTGDITFTNNYIVGTGTLGGGSGLFFAPGPDFIDPDNVNTNGTQYVRLRAGDDPSHIHLDTGDNSVYDWYFGDDSKYVMLSKEGVVRIQASGQNGAARLVLNDNGALKLAGGSSNDSIGPGTYLSSRGTSVRVGEETQVTIFTASQVWMSTVKLLIQAESTVTDGSGWDTQATELLIVKSFNGPSVNSAIVSNITTGGIDNDIFISNYFVSLVDGKITVNAEPINGSLINGASTNVYYSVSVVEMYSND